MDGGCGLERLRKGDYITKLVDNMQLSLSNQLRTNAKIYHIESHRTEKVLNLLFHSAWLLYMVQQCVSRLFLHLPQTTLDYLGPNRFSGPTSLGVTSFTGSDKNGIGWPGFGFGTQFP